MEISSDKSKIIVNSIKPRPSTNIQLKLKSVRRRGRVQILRIHTNQIRNINKGSKDQIGASKQPMTKLAKLRKVASFPTNIKLKSLVLSTMLYRDVRARSWGESEPLKTNTTGRYLAHHTGSTERTNMHGNRPITSLGGRSFCFQPSNIASYHSSAMSVDMIRCRKSYDMEQWTVDVAKNDRVNHGRTILRNE